jgi:hypothetical protein
MQEQNENLTKKLKPKLKYNNISPQKVSWAKAVRNFFYLKNYFLNEK